MELPEEEIEFFEEYVHEFGGYDFVFVDKLSPGHTCSICLVAMRNPVQTKCGHRFCEDCLLGTFREHHDRARRCPQDRNPIPEKEGYFRDMAWEREILSLRVKCKKNERGCDWTGQLRQYKEHKCQYEDVVCDDCDKEMQRRFLETHSTWECRNRIVQCDYCEEEFRFWCTEVHEGKECARFPLDCPQKCGEQKIPREKLANHIKVECLKTVVVCPFKKAGCVFRNYRSEYKNHITISNVTHLSMTWREVVHINQKLGKLDGLQSRIEELQEEIREMKDSLERNDDEIEELKSSEKNLGMDNKNLRMELTKMKTKFVEIDEEKVNTRLLTERVQKLETRLGTVGDVLSCRKDKGESKTSNKRKKEDEMVSQKNKKKRFMLPIAQPFDSDEEQ